ncbi:unnamed protein product [Fraxinus pennsylvanica]|uniref:Uncharacterized protein n=1 Tax=Fraxinus pennsylvanica TaxID=56036 RepID=A0AAD1ZDK1_9LAMI|nr:unnamed protein product [Fraxinus pennsylvanica]
MEEEILEYFGSDRRKKSWSTLVQYKSWCLTVGLTVCRTWAFNDGQWRALQKTPFVYDDEVFKYVKWGKAVGLNLTSDDDFFSHPTLQSYYKADVKVAEERHQSAVQALEVERRWEIEGGPTS